MIALVVAGMEILLLLLIPPPLVIMLFTNGRGGAGVPHLLQFICADNDEGDGKEVPLILSNVSMC